MASSHRRLKSNVRSRKVRAREVFTLTLVTTQPSSRGIQPPVGGRLGDFLPQWVAISPSPFILSINVKGYGLKLMSLPQPRFLGTRLPSNLVTVRALSFLVGDLVNQGVVLVKVPIEEVGLGFYSHMFVVQKPSGSYWFILNLKSLHPFIRYQHFMMESIFSAKTLFHPFCFMASLDF